MRIRTVKPGFWKSENLSSICPFSRLAAIALLNFADDHGYFVCNHLVIRGELFPFEEDSTNVRRAIDDLSRIGFIVIGKADNGKTYGHIPNFKDHQRVDRPQASEIACLDVDWSDSANARRKIDERSTTEAEAEADTEKEGKRKRSPNARPTEEEWLQHCQQAYSDWHPTCIKEQWAYYESVGWKTKAGPIKDWKRAAVTAHGNARSWGKLQPMAQRGGWQQQIAIPTNLDSSDMTPEMLEDARRF